MMMDKSRNIWLTTLHLHTNNDAWFDNCIVTNLIFERGKNVFEGNSHCWFGSVRLRGVEARCGYQINVMSSQVITLNPIRYPIKVKENTRKRVLCRWREEWWIQKVGNPGYKLCGYGTCDWLKRHLMCFGTFLFQQHDHLLFGASAT